MAQPFLVALELGLHPDASQWRNYSEVVQCLMSEVQRRLPTEGSSSTKTTPTTSSGSSTRGTAQPDHGERWILSLPPSLQSKRGVCRIYLLSPSFMVELLEALLRESGRSNQFGEACRKNFCFLVEAITPLIYQSTTATPNTSTHDSPFSSLVTTAQFTLDYVGGAQGLAIATSLLFSGIATVPSLLPMLRRRLQEVVKIEESWTAEAAAMLCITYLDGLGAASATTKHSDAAGPTSSPDYTDSSDNPWTTVRNREPTPRLSARLGSSPRLLGDSSSREASPQQSGEFIMLQRDPFINIPFPEKMPTAITVPAAVVVSVAILSSITLTVQPALKLGQWCLQALHTMPLTITACALSHLLLKFPKGFRVSTTAVSVGSSSSSSAPPLRFCEAVIIHCCRIVTTLFERRLQHGVHGAYRNAEECVLEVDEAIQSVDVMPCFLLLCIQAIQCNLGLPLCDDAQRHLGRLFVHASRLYVSHHSYIDELGSSGGSQEQQRGSRRGGRDEAGESDTATISVSRKRGCEREQQKPVDVVSQVFRAALRAVDLVLHDYAAGNPETLRQTLSQSGPPHGVLVNRSQEYGAAVAHQDLMESLIASIDPLLDQKIKTHIAATLNTTAKGAQHQAATKFSLIGWLPASSDLPVLGGFPFAADGGLCTKQKMWVVRRMLDYFRREWFLARVGLQTAQLTTTSVGKAVQREGFLDCLPRPL